MYGNQRTTQSTFESGQAVWFLQNTGKRVAAVVSHELTDENGAGTGKWIVTLETPEYASDSGERWAYADQLTPRFC